MENKIVLTVAVAIIIVLSYIVKGYLPIMVKYNIKSVGGKMIPNRKCLWANPLAIITLLLPICPMISSLSFDVFVDGGTTITVRVMGRPFRISNVRLLNKDELIRCNETVDTTNMRIFNANKPFINLTSSKIRHGGTEAVEFKNR